MGGCGGVQFSKKDATWLLDTHTHQQGKDVSDQAYYSSVGGCNRGEETFLLFPHEKFMVPFYGDAILRGTDREEAATLSSGQGKMFHPWS